jgi:hypothetical protein
MRIAPCLVTLAAFLVGVGASALAAPGLSGPPPVAGGPAPATLAQMDGSRYVLNPFESVSMSDEYIWTDNRHRAYVDPAGWHANGFLLFDVSGIPDNSTITGMTLRCYLEDAFNSPHNEPVVDVYYSGDDGWRRDTALPGTLSLDELLLGNVAFHEFVPYYDFTLDVNAHDWSVDLADDQICIGFTNTNELTLPSYVYFIGAYGDPPGPPPELTIETSNPTPVQQNSWGRVKSLYR